MQISDIDLGIGLTRAMVRSEADVIGDITADAFRNDPFNLWLFGNFPAISALFHAQARRIYVPNGFSYRSGEEGACMWMLPDQHANFGLTDYAVISWSTLIRSGPRAVVRAIKTGTAMDAQHPEFPHAYLFSIGVRPAAQGKGLGRWILKETERLIRESSGSRVYVETSQRVQYASTRAFYENCGYRLETVLADFYAPGDGKVIYCKSLT